MSGKIIPFRIAVNPDAYSTLMLAVLNNAEMHSKALQSDVADEEKRRISEAIAQMARERRMPVFDETGSKMNQTALVRELNKVPGVKINQPTLNRLMNGLLSGKEGTLKQFAQGFGISYVEFVGRIRPALQEQPAARPLSPEIIELTDMWDRIPTRQRKLFLEQLKAAAEFAAKFPELSAVLNEEATVAASLIRIQQQRTKR